MKDASALNADHQEARHQIISMETGLSLQFKKMCKVSEEIASSCNSNTQRAAQNQCYSWHRIYFQKVKAVTYFKQIISAAASRKAWKLSKDKNITNTLYKHKLLSKRNLQSPNSLDWVCDWIVQWKLQFKDYFGLVPQFDKKDLISILLVSVSCLHQPHHRILSWHDIFQQKALFLPTVVKLAWINHWRPHWPISQVLWQGKI